MTFKDAVGVFVRSFAALAAAFLLGFQVTIALPDTSVGDKALVLALGLAAAAVGSLVAVGWAYLQGQQTSALGKALRAAVEKIVGGIGVVAFSSVADVVAFGKLVTPLLIGAAFAFVLTLLSYVAPPATTPEP